MEPEELKHFEQINQLKEYLEVLGLTKDKIDIILAIVEEKKEKPEEVKENSTSKINFDELASSEYQNEGLEKLSEEDKNFIESIIEKFPLYKCDSEGKVLFWSSKMEEVTGYNIFDIKKEEKNGGSLANLLYSYSEKEKEIISFFVNELKNGESYEGVLFKAKIKNNKLENFVWNSYSISNGRSIRIIIDSDNSKKEEEFLRLEQNQVSYLEKIINMNFKKGFASDF